MISFPTWQGRARRPVLLGPIQLLVADGAHPEGLVGLAGKDEAVGGAGAADHGTALAAVVLKEAKEIIIITGQKYWKKAWSKKVLQNEAAAATSIITNDSVKKQQ